MFKFNFLITERMTKKTLRLKKTVSQKLLKQALFGESGFARITALIRLSENGDPEAGWLLETLLENERFKPIHNSYRMISNDVGESKK